MDNKPEEKKKQVTFSIPLSGYPRTMRFNQFSIENMGSYFVVHCAFIGKQGVVCDLFSFSISAHDVQINRNNILGYIDRMQNVPVLEDREWVTPALMRNVETIRIVSASNTGDNAELVLATFSLTAMLSKSKSSTDKQEFVAQPIALLSCEPALLKDILTKLFLDTNAA